MNKAVLKISKLTDRKNGYGMPIVEVASDSDIKVINRGYNEFEAVTEVDESDLLRLRQSEYSTLLGWTDTIHLEIKTPSRDTCAHYRLNDIYIGKTLHQGSQIQW